MEREIIKRFFIIRHGETDPNKNQIIQGSGLDAPLNEKGKTQANDFFSAYQHIQFDSLYSSALIRTWQSIEKFLQLPISHFPLKELNEISWGIKDGTKIDDTEQKIYQAMLDGWQSGLLDMSFEKGESPNEVAKRMKLALGIIMLRDCDLNILICIHGRAMRIFLCLLLNKPLTEMEAFFHSNLCLYVLEWDGREWELVLENDTRHLVVLT